MSTAGPQLIDRRIDRGISPRVSGDTIARGSLSPSSNQQEERPMYRVPDVDEVMAVAKELGIHLGPEEVGLYRKYLLEHLGELDSFVQARLEEPPPPMISA